MATLLITGERACFRRPEITGHSVSYDVITPLAARGIFECVHWSPSIWWRIERIEVIRPIILELTSDEDISTLALVDVSYVIEARFHLTEQARIEEKPAQHAAMFKRKMQQQKFVRTPRLGRFGFAASLQLLSSEDRPRSLLADTGTVDLGWMVYDRDVTDRRRMRFYRPIMNNGVIDVASTDPTELPFYSDSDNPVRF